MVDKQKDLDEQIKHRTKTNFGGYLFIFACFFGLAYFLIFSFFYHFFPKATDLWIKLLQPFTEKLANMLPGAVNVINQLSKTEYAYRIPLVQHSYGLSLLFSFIVLVIFLVIFVIGSFKGMWRTTFPSITLKQKLSCPLFLVLQIFGVYWLYWKEQVDFNPVSRTDFYSAYHISNAFMFPQLWLIPFSNLVSILAILLIVKSPLKKDERTTKF